MVSLLARVLLPGVLAFHGDDQQALLQLSKVSMSNGHAEFSALVGTVEVPQTSADGGEAPPIVGQASALNSEILVWCTHFLEQLQRGEFLNNAGDGISEGLEYAKKSWSNLLTISKKCAAAAAAAGGATAATGVAPAAGTTASPAVTTVAPAVTTVAPAVGTTAAPAVTTVAPAVGTTAAPAVTTVAPAVGTTAAPAVTTVAPACAGVGGAAARAARWGWPKNVSIAGVGHWWGKNQAHPCEKTCSSYKGKCFHPNTLINNWWSSDTETPCWLSDSSNRNKNWFAIDLGAELHISQIRFLPIWESMGLTSERSEGQRRAGCELYASTSYEWFVSPTYSAPESDRWLDSVMSRGDCFQSVVQSSGQTCDQLIQVQTHDVDATGRYLLYHTLEGNLGGAVSRLEISTDAPLVMTSTVPSSPFGLSCDDFSYE